MRVFARGIKRPFDVLVQCPHDTDARKHRRPANVATRITYSASHPSASAAARNVRQASISPASDARWIEHGSRRRRVLSCRHRLPPHACTERTSRMRRSSLRRRRRAAFPDPRGRGSLAKRQNRASCELCADGRPVQAKWAFILFFEPFKYLRCGDRPFRQMRIECARADIWRVDQFRSCEFLGLSLVRKRFGRPYALSLSPWQFK
jgi:hypothetical protein